MVLGKYFKAPVDRKRYSIDYTDWLDAGETVLSVTFGVTPVDASTLAIDGITIAPDAKSIVFYASLGVDATTYKAFATMVTTGGQTREDVVQFTVRAP